MDLINLWQRANEAKLGIAIKTNDRMLLRQQLYNARAKVGEEFDHISIVFPIAEGELWLVKRADESSK